MVCYLDDWPATYFHTSCRRKKKTQKKDSHQNDTSVLYISTNTFELVPLENNSSEIFQLSASFILKGTLLISEIANQLVWTLGAFQASGGGSFVPRRVLLPFSLEETAAPADRDGHLTNM